MDAKDVLILVAAVIFGVEAFLRRSLIAAGLCSFALAFVVNSVF